MQISNKIGSDVFQEDLLRLFHLRKLIGSQTERVRVIEDCLKTTLATRMNEDSIKKLEYGTNVIFKAQIDNNYSLGIS